jgi:hypothetical protein
MQAKEWAKEYADGKSTFDKSKSENTIISELSSYILTFLHTATPERFVQFWNDGNERNESEVLFLRYEDLFEGQSTSINKVLAFIGDETVISRNDSVKISSPPSLVLLRDKNGEEHVSKSTAFASPALVGMIWNLVKESAQSFGYAKPPTTNSSSPDDITLLKLDQGLPQGRYLTYVPSGGELSDQLLELEVAVELAKRSHRRLMLPPFINPEAIRTDDEDKASWSQIIDMDDFSEKVDFVHGDRGVMPARFSELTLGIFDRYNTNWDLNHLKQEEQCLSDFVSRSVIESNSSVVSRSPQCLFESTEEVNVLRFVDLIGTFGKDTLSIWSSQR